MSAPKYSIGPWHVYHSNGVIEIQSRSYGVVVKWNGFDGTNNKPERDLANAHLIAAAPDLLDALKTAKWMLERDHIDDQKMRVIEKCESAISKATGEET